MAIILPIIHPINNVHELTTAPKKRTRNNSPSESVTEATTDTTNNLTKKLLGIDEWIELS